MINHTTPPIVPLDSHLKDTSCFSFFENPITNINPLKGITITDAYNLIVSDVYAEVTDKLRRLKELKRKKYFKASSFPYVTFCGEFSTRNDNNLKAPSNLFAIDLDHLGVNHKVIKQRLIADKKLNPFLVYTSPSGDGLKVVIGIDYESIAAHANERVTVIVWHAVNNYFCKEYSDLIPPNDKGEIIDSACKDISRACFLCHDAEAYLIQDNSSLLGQEFIIEMLPKFSEVIVNHKQRTSAKTKSVNPKTTLTDLCKRHLLGEDNHHSQLLAFIGAAKNFSFPEQQVVNYIKNYVHIAPDSRHGGLVGINELVNEIYVRYSTNTEGIKYLSSVSFGFNLFRFNYSAITKKYELVGMLWDEVLNSLHNAGFAKRRLGNNYRYIKVNGCIIRECSAVDMRDFMTSYIMSISDALYFNFQGVDYHITSAAIREVYLKNSNNFFNDKWLEHLRIHEKPIIKDTKFRMFFFFKNCLVIISKEEGLQQQQWRLIEDYCVWDSQIIQRDFYYNPDFTNSHFFAFIQNVTAKDAKRYKSMKAAIGYLLHHYYNESEGQAVILLDETITNIGKPMGGTGKGLIVNALKQLRNVAKVDGKHFNAQNRFCWELVSHATQIVWIDDAKPDFDFAVLHSNLTDGWTIEKKYSSQLFIPSIDSPKSLITSNSIITGEGTTNIRRQFLLELSNFYSRQIVNGDEKPIEATHGCIFFNDSFWDIDEWNMFYSFMLDCALQYLSTGLISYDGVNIDINRFRQSTDEEFTEWTEEQAFIKNFEYETAIFYENYLRQFYGERGIVIGQKKFTGYIKSFATYKKWIYNRVQKGGKSYFFFT